MTFFTITAGSDGGLFYIGMTTAFGTVVTMKNTNIQYVSSTSGSGGIFAVFGTTISVIIESIYFYQPRANGGHGGVFYFANSGTSQLTLYSCNIFNAGAS